MLAKHTGIFSELEPDNVDARLIPGVYDYVAGSLPLGYRILGFLAGYHGDRSRGIRTHERVAREGKTNRVDAEILLAAIYRREHRAGDALSLIQGLIARFPRNYLLHFVLVQMYSDLGDKPNAMAEIARIWDLHRNGRATDAGRESRSYLARPYNRPARTTHDPQPTTQNAQPSDR